MVGKTANRVRSWAERLKSEVVTLWFCMRHPRTPFLAKALAATVVVYAFSPIDLIPDFIPVLGYLDDLLILPAGVWLVSKLVPQDVAAECRAQAAQWLLEQRPTPRNYLGAVLIVVAWAAILWAVWRWIES